MCLNVRQPSDSKIYYGVTIDEFSELVCTVKIAQLSTQPFVRLPVTVSNRLDARHSEIEFIERKTKILF